MCQCCVFIFHYKEYVCFPNHRKKCVVVHFVIAYKFNNFFLLFRYLTIYVLTDWIYLYLIAFSHFLSYLSLFLIIIVVYFVFPVFFLPP
jgi:hypothetical protein